MYATEALGILLAYRENTLSVSMVSTNFLRNPALMKVSFSKVNRFTTRGIFGEVAVPRMWTCRCSMDAKSVGGDVFSVTSSSKSDVDYLGQSTKGDLNLKVEHLESFGIEGQESLEGPIEEVARVEAREAEGLLNDLGIPSPSESRHSPRGIFCSRTLNLRSISAIGYDMDYTLMHYNVMAWEGRAYDYCMENLRNMGFPVNGLSFDPDLVIRGLVIDKERGNLVKADRFGYIKRAMHGTEMLSTRAVRYGLNLTFLIVHCLLEEEYGN